MKIETLRKTLSHTDRIRQREEWVVASLLDNLDKPWGPNVCTALANTDYWENPVARQLAVAIDKAGHTAFTRANISRILAPECAPWLRHPSYWDCGLPIDAAEYYAFDLCAHYRSQRLKWLVGDAYTKLKEHPECAKTVASALVGALQEFV